MAKTKKKKGLDMGRALLWSAMIVSAPRWAGAMLAADVGHVDNWISVMLNILNVVSGLGMGVVEVLATAYLLDALRRLRPTITRRRKGGNVEVTNYQYWGTLGFVIGLMVLTPFVLAPYMVARISSQDVATVLGTQGWQYIWAVTVILTPVFVVGGVSFAQPGLVSIGKLPEVSSEKKEPKVSEKLPESSEKDIESSDGAKKYPETFGKWTDWRKVPDTEKRKIAKLSIWEEVAERYGTSKKTSENWLRSAKKLFTTKLTKEHEDG